MWKGRGGYDTFPEAYIVCPLEGDRLHAYYDIAQVDPDSLEPDTVYAKQLAAYTKYLKHPPLTKRKHPHTKSAMRTLSASTIQQKLRNVNGLVGFCVGYQDEDATITHVLDPLLVAKYIGFLHARGNGPYSLRTQACAINQASFFVASTHCHGRLVMSEEQQQATSRWLFNLVQQCMKECRIDSSPNVEYTLHEAWLYAESEIDKFLQAFYVSGGCCGWGLCLLPVLDLSSLVDWCRTTMRPGRLSSLDCV